jgi:hypothetical protein
MVSLTSWSKRSARSLLLAMRALDSGREDYLGMKVTKS